MKKLSILALCLVLTAALLTGCRDRNQPMETSKPTTESTTQTTTAPTTEATRPSTAATQPSETMDRGNGPMDSTSGMVNPTNGADGTVGNDSTGTTDSSAEGRSIAPMPRGR